MARATRARFGKHASRWSRLSSDTRLLVGTAIIVLVGLAGQTPKSLFGLQIIWPHAALLGAAGWGLSGHRFRPMTVLILLGLVQDISFEANLGCFVIVNLVTYAATAYAAELYDAGNDPLIRAVIPTFSIALGFFVLWAVASATTGQVAEVRSLVGAFAMTLGLHFLLARFFDLGVGATEYVWRGN